MSRNLFAGVVLALATLPSFAADVKAMMKEADNYRITRRGDGGRHAGSGDEGRAARQGASLHGVREARAPLDRAVQVAGRDRPEDADDGRGLLPADARHGPPDPRDAAPQKLLGDASTGDIATMTWAEDYAGTVVRRRDGGGQAVRAAAPRSDAGRRELRTHRVVLSPRPVASRCGPISTWPPTSSPSRPSSSSTCWDGRRQVTVMRLVDQIQTNRETLVRLRVAEAEGAARRVLQSDVSLAQRDP